MAAIYVGKTSALVKDASSSTLYGILYFVFMSAVILGAAYYVTKYLAGRTFKSSGNKNLRVIETVPLGIDKSLVLVKAGEHCFLIGCTQKNITLLAEVDQEKLAVSSINGLKNDLDGESFDSYMDRLGQEGRKPGIQSVKQSLDKLKFLVRGNKTDV